MFPEDLKLSTDSVSRATPDNLSFKSPQLTVQNDTDLTPLFKLNL